MDDNTPNSDDVTLQIPEDLRIRFDKEDVAIFNQEALPLNSETAAHLRTAIRSSAACKRGRWLLIGIGLTLAGFCTKPDVITLLVIAGGLLIVGLTVHFQLGVLIAKHEAFINACMAHLSTLKDSRDLKTLVLFQPINFPELQNVVIDRMTVIADGIKPNKMMDLDCGHSIGEPEDAEAEWWAARLKNVEAEWWVDPTQFIVAIIKMFERTHNPCAIDVVRRYAKDGALLLSGEPVRRAARESLPVLEAAFLKQKEREMLLRASGPSSAQEHELLRAASVANSTQPESLLRPSSSYDGSL